MSYIQDPNNSEKQIPKGFHRRGTNTVFSRATCPAILTIQKHPDHILINNSGSYFFKYDTTGSHGDVDAGGDSPYELGIKIGGSNVSTGVNESGQRMNTGDVTFVYRGKG